MVLTSLREWRFYQRGRQIRSEGLYGSVLHTRDSIFLIISTDTVCQCSKLTGPIVPLFNIFSQNMHGP